MDRDDAALCASSPTHASDRAPDGPLLRRRRRPRPVPRGRDLHRRHRGRLHDRARCTAGRRAIARALGQDPPAVRAHVAPHHQPPGHDHRRHGHRAHLHLRLPSHARQRRHVAPVGPPRRRARADRRRLAGAPPRPRPPSTRCRAGRRSTTRGTTAIRAGGPTPSSSDSSPTSSRPTVTGERRSGRGRGVRPHRPRGLGDRIEPGDRRRDRPPPRRPRGDGGGARSQAGLDRRRARRRPPGASAVTGDVRDPDAVAAPSTSIAARHGRLDGVVANVGGAAHGRARRRRHGPLLASQLDLNLVSAFTTLRAAQPLLDAAGWRGRAGLGDCGRQRDARCSPPTARPRRAVEHLARTMAAEWGPRVTGQRRVPGADPHRGVDGRGVRAAPRSSSPRPGGPRPSAASASRTTSPGPATSCCRRRRRSCPARRSSSTVARSRDRRSASCGRSPSPTRARLVRVVVLGAGALGSLYGAWSADAGHDVVARGAPARTSTRSGPAG